MNPDQLRLKQTTGWFPAGDGFLRAMKHVTDGSFKLFVLLCLKAGRFSACYSGSYEQLAGNGGQSRDDVVSHLDELQRAGLCQVIIRKPPFVMVRIDDNYWPYQNNNGQSAPNHPAQYVAAIRDAFLALGCTHGRFGPSEESQALELQKRNVPLQAVQDAMLIGACRKYVSWLNTGYSEPISSIRYFDRVIEEIQACPLRSGYREFLPIELKRLRRHWAREVEKSGLKREGCVFPSQAVPQKRPDPNADPKETR
jgi:hypothetical protein